MIEITGPKLELCYKNSEGHYNKKKINFKFYDGIKRLFVVIVLMLLLLIFSLLLYYIQE